MRFHAIAIISLAGLCAIAYHNSLGTSFHFDDFTNIVKNPAVHVESLSAGSIWQASLDNWVRNRPLLNATWALNYALGGLDVRGYHLVNIAVHLANGILLYSLILLTLAGPAAPPLYKEARRSIALCAAALWLVNPLQTQAVTYIVQRAASLCALFFLAALISYVRSRVAARPAGRVLWTASAALCGAAAVATKESGVILAAFVPLYEIYFPAAGPRENGRAFRRLFPGAALICAAVLVCAAILWQRGLDRLIVAKVMDMYAVRPFTVTERILTQPRVMLFYAGLFFFPHPSRLNIDHDFPTSTGLFHPPQTAAALGILAAVVVAAALGARRYRFLSFTLIWYLGTQLIESSVVPLEMVFEHRAYLPSMGLALAVAIGWMWIREAIDRPMGPKRAGWLAWAAFAVAAAFLVTGTIRRNLDWHNEKTLWSDAAAKSPGKARPWNNLGRSQEEGGDLSKAIRHYRKAIAIDTNFVKAYLNLGNAFFRMGRHAEAADAYRTAVRIDAGSAGAAESLGQALLAGGDFQGASAAFEHAVALAPGSGEAHLYLGKAEFALAKWEAAVGSFARAISLGLDEPELRYLLARARLGRGEKKAAIEDLKRAVALGEGVDDPGQREAARMARALLDRLEK